MTMKRIISGLMIGIASCFLYSCTNLEKEIDLALPEYENKLVVECYLEPGQPYRLLLTESLSYFEDPNNPFVDNAMVIISHNGTPDTLKNDFLLDVAKNKTYNYTSPALVPFDYTGEFTLEIRDRKGRYVTGRTIIPVPVKIDTIKFEYNEDSLAFPLTTFHDDLSTTNFYRYQVTRDSYLGDELIDFILDDKLNTSSEISLGSAYKLESNAYIIVTLYHITEDYYDFLESAGSAIDANGNPFGQPATIKSNVKGGLGIFTGLSFDRKILNRP